MEQAKVAEATEHFSIVIVGHVDHGKSTVIGRLYADTGSLPDGKVEQIRQVCEQQGKEFEYAFLFDALMEEQDQGITIDTARTFFCWGARKYTIIDAPGHKEFLKNMISGASRAEAALLVIDANEGVKDQSRQHGYMLSLLGIKQITVLVNKMDLVDYREETFRTIENEYRGFLADLKVAPRSFCPVSAKMGDNIAEKSLNMPWFKGPTVLEALGAFTKEASGVDKPLRLPVQDVYKFDGRRIIAGRIVSGRLKVGDKLVFSPSNKTASVNSLEEFNAVDLPTEAIAGQSIGFTLDEQIFIERGEIVSLQDEIPYVSSIIRANIFWMGRRDLEKGRKYILRLCTEELECEVAEVRRIINTMSLETDETCFKVGKNEVAEVTIRTKSDLAFDIYHEFESTGRFVIVDGYDVCGGGIVMEFMRDDQETFRTEARRRDLHWVKGEVLPPMRAESYGHLSALILFFGDHSRGIIEAARKLEKRLVEKGKHSYMLNGENLQWGIGTDLPKADSAEVMRRFGEVIRLLIDAGMIVISPTSNFSQEDFQTIKTLVHPAQVILIHVTEKEETLPAGADFSLAEVRNFEVAADEIIDKLKERGILSTIHGPSSFAYTI